MPLVETRFVQMSARKTDIQAQQTNRQKDKTLARATVANYRHQETGCQSYCK